MATDGGKPAVVKTRCHSVVEMCHR